ncbi:GtrA family protein [Pedobacter sp. AW31-3R]|uniref:GtrA family protein n=1 Tax=Pedobacter sp. AW31-3R TaxID=3445781 RepID=UPI003F9EC596
MTKKNTFIVFAKAQASAFTGGIVDYLIMVACTELLHIHYTLSILISGMIGAIVNFSINRHWTFRHGEHTSPAIAGQLFKFCTVVAGSIVLKSSGTYLLTTWLGIDYKISRVITDIIVSLGFNYVLQKYWVFRGGNL